MILVSSPCPIRLMRGIYKVRFKHTELLENILFIWLVYNVSNTTEPTSSLVVCNASVSGFSSQELPLVLTEARDSS
jgi:hypothetical protein